MILIDKNYLYIYILTWWSSFCWDPVIVWITGVFLFTEYMIQNNDFDAQVAFDVAIYFWTFYVLHTL